MTRLIKMAVTTMTVCVAALSLMAGPASAAPKPGPFSTWPPPAAGNVRGTIYQGTPTCAVQSGVKICDATVYTTGLMSGWATSNQAYRTLNLEWKIRKHSGTVVKTGSASCTGATGAITSCDRTGPSYGVRWPASSTVKYCVDTIGYAYYYVSSNGNTAKVTASHYACVTLSATGGGGGLRQR
ncbi:hypothetical protein AB0H28_17590 [Micromonospora sp. NPDC050980]|uniref:hypothetical protein n=1 Tax=Micromonospora sp. NPDC050980 TaxID=3155161 RepID=UPI0033C563E8